MVCLGLEPGGGRMVGADESTERWRHPSTKSVTILVPAEGEVYVLIVYIGLDWKKFFFCPDDVRCTSRLKTFSYFLHKYAIGTWNWKLQIALFTIIMAIQYLIVKSSFLLQTCISY